MGQSTQEDCQFCLGTAEMSQENSFPELSFDRDLILEQLERFLVIANSGIQNYVGRVLAKDGLVGIRTRGRWHKDLRLLDLTASCIGASGRLCCRLCIELFVQASKTVVILAPFSLFDVDFLLFGLRLRLICAFSS